MTMVVNGLVTGLIAFRILKVFLEVKAATSTSIEQSLGSSGGTKLRHIIFVIIESGMTLLVIQLVRLVLYFVEPSQIVTLGPAFFALDYCASINEMFNVIIRSVHFYFFFTEKKKIT